MMDRPDRKTIQDILDTAITVDDNCKVISKTDQILALFPDGCASCETPLLREGELYQKIKVAKKQEGERIRLELEKAFSLNKWVERDEAVSILLQALKGKK